MKLDPTLRKPAVSLSVEHQSAEAARSRQKFGPQSEEWGRRKFKDRKKKEEQCEENPAFTLTPPLRAEEMRQE